MKNHIENLSIALLLAVVFLFPLITTIQSVNAQFLGSVYIVADGSVVGTNTIQRNGNIYTLTGNISGGIQVQKSDIVIDGAGYTVQGNGGVGIDLSNGIGQDPSRSTISNITIENLRIVNCSNGVFTNGGGNNTFYNDYVANCSRSQGGFGFFLLGCSYNNISYCTFDNESIISMDYQANYNTVTENNLMNSGILVWLSGYETVDKNYWSDYFTKYPNATEIDSSGIGNTPYVFYTAQNGSIPVIYQDNHPLINPISSLPISTPTPTQTSSPISTSTPSPSPSQTIEPSPSIPEFPAWTTLLLLVIVAALVVLIVSNGKRVLHQ
jgi:hypothetical protein